MTPFERQIQAAQGWLDLGLPLDAQEELLSLAPDECIEPRTLGLRVSIYQALGEWENMRLMALLFSEAEPDMAQGPISLAYATRRAQSLEAGLAILTDAADRFPKEPIIRYNLACYEAQLGRLDRARMRLTEAMTLGPGCRELALADPDLAALHGELGA